MKAWRFQIPFTSPITLKGTKYSVREGILIESAGRWAEASPLPGFSSESIDDVIDALRGNQAPPASLKFALNSLDEPINGPIDVPWNFLLMGDREHVLAGVERCANSGCQAAKLKVGRNEIQTDVALVRKVREALPDSIQLRLDANRAWSLQDAIFFLKSFDDIQLEYIEEPLEDVHQLEQLFSHTGVNYALDETLLDHDELDPWPNAAALICKPTIMGGRNSVERLSKYGKPVVFSAAFESGVGIARIVQLAANVSPNVPAGLDTLDWLSDDLLLNSPRKHGGMFTIQGEPMVDASNLESIAL